MATVLNEATVELMDYQQFLDYAAESLNYAGQTELLNHITQKLRSNPYNAQSSLTTREQWAQEIARELEENGYRIEYNGNNQWTGTVFPNTAQVSTPNPVNSNITNVGRGSVRSWYGGLNEFNPSGWQNWVPQRFPVSGGLGSKAMYFLGSANYAVMAASAGIWAGKTFDGLLYNAMPDFWDSIGFGTLNPETWGGLIEGSGSPFAGLMNFILGVDGENGNAQAYMNENALAYLLYGMYMNDVFSSGEPSYTYSGPSSLSTFSQYYDLPIYVIPSVGSLTLVGSTSYSVYNFNAPNAKIFTSIRNTSMTTYCYMKRSDITESSIVIGTREFHEGSTVSIDDIVFNAPSSNYLTRDSNTQFAYNIISLYANETLWKNQNLPYMAPKKFVSSSDNLVRDIGTIFFDGTYNSGATIEGIGDQAGATLPDTTGWDDLANVLPSLQQQYPDAFSNPMVWNTDSPYDDTAGNQTRYIPVPFPFANSATDTQPISGTQTQTNTALNTTPQDIIDLLTKTIQQTDTQPATPPANPTDTGTGDTPVPTAPTGSASALWSVYHPTQAQVNSFGAWLWGSPFLTNIGKLFQNPIEGVISLHKVFAPPVDSGSGNIVVGTLDSGVASATVNQQYVEVDCGSVTLSEDFGNVFDYDPYTKVALYLPFVGIVPLNVADVMRSTINVKYGVDVFTGACIAMVSVSRDGNAATLYQYSGNCAVHYPLSNVQQSQLLSGLITVAAGIGAIVASGGAAAPAVSGAASAAGVASGASGVLSALHTNVGRSGGFSANAGAMGIKIPYLIIERPQTKVAETFPRLIGYPTNYSVKLGSCSNHVVVKHVHVEGINATESELEQIESLLKTGVLV